jgi:uncharacterized RDD family membrane protein YckC
MSELPAGPGWYEDEHDPLLLRYFDGVVWTSHTTPRRSPTAQASTIGRATPGVIPGRAGNPGAWAQPGQQGQPGPQDQPGPGQAPGAMPPAGYNPYTQGWAAPRGDVLPDGAVLAEWWRRLVGRIIDVVITAVITVVVAFPWISQAASTMSDFFAKTLQAAENGSTPPSQSEFTEQFLTVALPITLVSIVVSLVYETVFLTMRGATPGKMIMGTVVRRVEGPGRLSVVTALRRQVIWVGTSLLSLVPLLSILGSALSILDPAWLLWDAKRQCLHDKLADTVVVLRNPGR